MSSELDAGGSIQARSRAAGPQWRWSIAHSAIEPINILSDAVVIIALVASLWTGYRGQGGLNAFWSSIGIGSLICALFIPVAKLRGAYSSSTLLSGDLRGWDVALIWLGVTALLGIAAHALDLAATLPADAGPAFILWGLVGLLGHRAAWSLLIERALANGRVRGRKILLISQYSANSPPDNVPELGRSGLHIERNIAVNPLANDDSFISRQMEQVIHLSLSLDIEEVVISADMEYWQRLRPHLLRLRQIPVPVSLVPTGGLAELVRRPTRALGSSVLFELQRAPLNAKERLIKRSLDLAGALTGLLLLVPLFILVALLIKLDSRGPVLFRQTRLGFNGRPFKIYKFRTMRVLEDGADIKQATRGDDRVTNLGRLLRHTSIDELPQLLNVLKGEMSLVGPRPHAVSHDDQFGRLIADYAYRRKMKPGITGWAQVQGYRGGTPKVDLMERRVHLDILYIENWSIWLDFRIIVQTVVEMVRAKNAY